MSRVAQRFLHYAKIDTMSNESANTTPSSEGQFNLARLLVAELEEVGASDVRLDRDHCYVYACIPATTRRAIPAIGFIAHLDTSPDVSGKQVNPQIITSYSGQDIVLSAHDTLSPATCPDLSGYTGMDIITSDGTTLLGADDKAGIAEIMEMAHYFLEHPELEHGDIKICFTPDEEIGRGPDFFDLQAFGAQYAYTVDGGKLGEISYENFNAASATVCVRGISMHPGDAKGKMINALHIAMELHAMLPANETPEHTEGYEGFFHLTSMTGDCAAAELSYIIRDHDRGAFAARKQQLCNACRAIQDKYGAHMLEYTVTDTYYNMRDVLTHHPHLVENAVTAMRALGIVPIVQPIRGGTDGARLSYMGLPCPNLGTGGHNFHSRTEYIPIQAMEQAVNLLIQIVRTYAQEETRNATVDTGRLAAGDANNTYSG